MTRQEAKRQAKNIVIALINDYMDSCDEEMKASDRAKLYGELVEIRAKLER